MSCCLRSLARYGRHQIKLKFILCLIFLSDFTVLRLSWAGAFLWVSRVQFFSEEKSRKNVFNFAFDYISLMKLWKLMPADRRGGDLTLLIESDRGWSLKIRKTFFHIFFFTPRWGLSRKEGRKLSKNPLTISIKNSILLSQNHLQFRHRVQQLFSSFHLPFCSPPRGN